MNRIHLYMLGFLLLLAGVSCKKTFLDRNPLAQPSSGTFWKTEDDIKLALAGAYNTLARSGDGFGAMSIHWDGISDNAWARSNSFNTVAQGTIESTTGGIVSDVYFNDYRSIATCNYFLAHVGEVPIDKTKIDLYAAEVRLLRAYYYFQLTQVYGGVPVTLQPETYTNPKRAQSPKDDVLKVVYDDLDFAISKLDDVAYTGRAVKGTAIGLKTRVLLFNNRWQDAATLAKQIIDGGKFSLSNSYYGLFVKPGQNANPEIMFSVRYQLPNMFHTLDYQYGWDQWEMIQPIKNLVDAYEASDGKPIGQSGVYNPALPYQNRDPRLKLSVYVPGDPWKYSTT
ncbi:MAG: RagB/SusD family nutrient uptake outer membrane protein, partial [Williamsia sp.]|nr:RagB/SusD family nutrient uptake outer membrane protein [Williamsia sp.]